MQVLEIHNILWSRYLKIKFLRNLYRSTNIETNDIV